MRRKPLPGLRVYSKDGRLAVLPAKVDTYEEALDLLVNEFRMDREKAVEALRARGYPPPSKGPDDTPTG